MHKKISGATIDAVVEGLDCRYGLRHSYGAGDLAAPDTLSEALGYSQFSPVRELGTKRGKWRFFFAREKGALPGSAVAFYAANDVAFLDEKVEVGYLFMSKPGRVDINEMGRNAEVLTPALLEKNPSRSQIVLTGVAVGAALGIILSEYLAFQAVRVPRSTWLDRLMFDFSSSGLGALLGAGITFTATDSYNSTLPQNAAACLSNPEAYIYGRDAAAVIKTDLAYSKLLETGASGVTREAFRDALAVAGVSVPQ